MTNETLKPNENNDGETSPLFGTITRLESQIGRLASEVGRLSARNQIAAALDRAGAHSPSLLLDAVESRMQFNDAGEIENAAALIASLKSDFPEQFHPAGVPASVDAGVGAAPARALTKDELARMSPQQISELDWSAVRNVLARA